MSAKKAYIQTGILPEFDAPHSPSGSPDIDVGKSRPIGVGDRVYHSHKNRAGIVDEVIPVYVVYFDGEPNHGYHCERDFLTLESSWSCPAKFAGQDQDAKPPESAPQNLQGRFGEYWIETVYKTVNGKRYGPYKYKRWRDEKGRKRSKYLGKVSGK